MRESSFPLHFPNWLNIPSDDECPVGYLPFGYMTAGGIDRWMLRAGGHALALKPLWEAGFIPRCVEGPFDPASDRVRADVFRLLTNQESPLATDQVLQEAVLFPLQSVVPAGMPSNSLFVDGYAGIHHAENVGRIFRPDQPALLPNYRHVPISYVSFSPLLPSGLPIHRPFGLVQTDGIVKYQPTEELDFELEFGALISTSRLRPRMSPEEAQSAIVGFVVVNDWSARDVQRLEYQPLGPMLGKAFATTLSPWVIPPDTFEGLKVDGDLQEPAPLPHLAATEPRTIDLDLEVWHSDGREQPFRCICRSNIRNMYWSFGQIISHWTHTMQRFPTERIVLGSGTLSGTAPDEFGSCIEMSEGGKIPWKTAGDQERTYLQDYDSIALRAYATLEGQRRLLGECKNIIIPPGD